MIPPDRYQPKPDRAEQAGTIIGVTVLVTLLVLVLLLLTAGVVLAWKAVL